MNKELEINNNFFANNGAIGRREFIINLLILNSITVIPNMFFNIWFFTNISEISEFFNINKAYFNAPLLLQILCLFNMAFSSLIGVSNIKRRLNDIFAQEKTLIKIVFSSIFVLANCYYFFPFIFIWIISLLNFIIIIYLMIKKGKITSKLEPDPLKEFNFGAFFGTWIWGLFNKTYKPLWILLLTFTPFALYFSIYCGFMGNRWIYNSTKSENIEEFNEKQKNQAIAFGLLSVASCVVLPIVIVIIVTMLIIVPVIASNENIQKSVSEKIETFANAMDTIAQSYFVSYVISEDENIFYIEKDIWASAQYSEKIDLFDLAAGIAAKEKNTSRYDERNKTKLYEAKTKQLLAEFKYDGDIEKDGFRASVSKIMKAYKFYKLKK